MVFLVDVFQLVDRVWIRRIVLQPLLHSVSSLLYLDLVDVVENVLPDSKGHHNVQQWLLFLELCEKYGRGFLLPVHVLSDLDAYHSYVGSCSWACRSVGLSIAAADPDLRRALFPC